MVAAGDDAGYTGSNKGLPADLWWLLGERETGLLVSYHHEAFHVQEILL